MVKLGDCSRGFRSFFGINRKAKVDLAEQLATGQCAVRDSRLEAQLSGRSPLNNSLLPFLPWAYCTHAFVLSRRMAAHLIEQAFPVSDVFDKLLVSHITRSARRQGLRLWSFNSSLFAQVAKVMPPHMLPPALRSYERVEQWRPRGRGGPKRGRQRGYRPPRPLL